MNLPEIDEPCSFDLITMRLMHPQALSHELGLKNKTTIDTYHNGHQVEGRAMQFNKAKVVTFILCQVLV